MTSCARLQPSWTSVWLLPCFAAAAHAQQPVTAPVAATKVVEGRVVDMRGEGVPLAKVWLATRTAPDQVVARTIADGEGCFRVGNVPNRDDLQTRATADGHCVAIGMSFDNRTITVTLQHAATVTGVLRNRAGTPMPDTTVAALVNGRNMRAAPCEARTDAAGRFVLRSVPLAPMQISAWIPGEGMASIAHHVAADCDVVVQPGDTPTTSIAIAVEGLPDQALATLRVAVREQRDGDLVRLPPPLDTIHMATPEVLLELLPDAPYRVSVRAADWQFSPEAMSLEPKRGPHRVKFTASPADAPTHACKLQVRDDSGKPAADVALMMRPVRGGSRVFAVTDADGKVTFDTRLAIGSMALLCSDDDRWVTTRSGSDADTASDLQARGQHSFLVDPSRVEQVQLAAACSVRGRILRHDGRPASFTWVELQDQRANREPEWSRADLTCTDREGHFVLPRLHASDTSLRVRVASPNGAWDGPPFEMRRPGTAIRLPEARLAPPAVIEGVLRDGGQHPVPGVRVDLFAWDAARFSAHHVDGTITDREGRYRFLGVAPGSMRLRLTADPDDRALGGSDAGQIDIEPGQVRTCDLELPSK